MYAIFEDGGRQYKVEEGQELEVDYREVSAGDKITFDRVLAVRAEESLKLGTPMLSGQRDGRSGDGDRRAEALHPKVPPPQDVPQADRPSAALHQGEDSEHLGGLADFFAVGRAVRLGLVARRHDRRVVGSKLRFGEAIGAVEGHSLDRGRRQSRKRWVSAL